MSFHDFFEQKKVDPKDIPNLKSRSPRDKTRQSKTLGRKPTKKKKFGARDRTQRSKYNVAIGRRRRKGGKTKSAREILAKKHGIKKAIQKDHNAEYFFDHLKIQELMKKFGYNWQDQDGSWLHKDDREAPKPKKKRIRKKKFSLKAPKRGRPSKDKDEKETDGDDSVAKKDTEDPINLDDFIIVRHGQRVKASEEDLTNFSIIGAGGIEYDVTEEDIMTYQARLILSLIHGKMAMLKFEEHEEETEEESAEIDDEKVTVITVEPIIERENVLDQIENLGYEYWPELDEWKINDEFPFPDIIDSDEEDIQSIIARSYVTAFGYFEALAFDKEKKPTGLDKQEVIELIQEHDFIWDETNKTWDHVPSQKDDSEDQASADSET